jgi:hypothetical protein
MGINGETLHSMNGSRGGLPVSPERTRIFSPGNSRGTQCRGKTFCHQKVSRNGQAQQLTRHATKKEANYTIGSMTPLKTLLIVLGVAAIVGSLIEIFGPTIETADPPEAQPANELIILK